MRNWVEGVAEIDNGEPPMTADERRKECDRLTEAIIGAAYRVHNALGIGFLEKVYENALALELRRGGTLVEQQASALVHYEGAVVGEYFADLLVSRLVIVELKAVKAFDEIHMAQCLNYLKATGITVCLLLNFGAPKLEIKRIVHRF
jgi:GxxExxY protein